MDIQNLIAQGKERTSPPVDWLESAILIYRGTDEDLHTSEQQALRCQFAQVSALIAIAQELRKCHN